jgi:hypothetical protein
VSITGLLRHESREGDGVQAFVVSSRTGELGRWTAHGSQGDTTVPHVEVQRGDTLDFVVHCRTGAAFDAFTWSPVVRVVRPAGPAASRIAEWSAETGFRGPPAEAVKPLTPWERYAQVLLLSNEFVFVD